MNRHLFIITFLVLGTCFTSYSQEISTSLQRSFQTFKDQPALKNGIAALHVVNGQTGAIIFDHNGEIGLPTASTLKVITSITALDLLGVDYTYKTKVYYSGNIDSVGILHGNIVIEGSGDPTLGSDRYKGCDANTILNKWITSIKNAGIIQIDGKVIADDRLYNGNDVPSGWIWGDMGNYYGAGISALNWRENKVGINFSKSAIGKEAYISGTTSDISYLDLINTVTTGNNGSGDNVYAYSAPYSNKVYLKGTYAADLKKTIEIAMPDPAFDLARQLHQKLTADSIAISQNPTTGQRLLEQDSTLGAKTRDLDIHLSPKLTEIVYWFNQKSLNLYGEALLKSIAQISGGKTTTSDGANYLKKYWNQKLRIAEQELKIIDGSGLSSQNNVTAQAMTRIMQYAQSRPWFGDFVKSLPNINQMTMKSGTIGGTLAYTGFHTSKSGQKYTFTLFVYNYADTTAKMRERMFTLLNQLK